jgi:hypothetical protein
MPGSRSGEHTVTVPLPGGVMVGDRRLGHAELRPLSGHEEEWLARHRGLPSALAVTWILDACLVGIGDAAASGDLARNLLVGDRDYLILALRRMTLGDRFQGMLPCPACAAPMDISFGAADVPVEPRPQTAASYTLEVGSAGIPARTIRFRLPTGGDQEAVLDMEPGAAVEALLARCLVDDGGTPLAIGEREAVIDAMDRLAPQLDLELDLTCPECGHAFLLPFDVTTFFLHEMGINGDQLLRETHALALSYHWSEAEILNLGRDRRRAYLGLLRETLHGQ